jgi:hypothetical protein
VPNHRAEIKLDLPHVLWIGGAGFALLGLFLFAFHELSPNPVFTFQILLAFTLFFFIFSRHLANKANGFVASVVMFTATVIALAFAVFAYQNAYTEIWYFGNNLSADTTPSGNNYVPLVSDIENLKQRIFRSAALPAAVFLLGGTVLLLRSRFLPGWVFVLGGAWIILWETSLVYIGFKSTPNTLVLEETVLLKFNIYFGLCALFVGYICDIFWKPNNGFWLSKLGWLIFGVGMGQFYEFDFMTAPFSGWPMGYEQDLSKEVFLVACFLSVGFSVFTRRPGGISIAAMGVFAYFAEHFLKIFNDQAILGASIMVLIGFALVLVGTRIAKLNSNSTMVGTRGLERLRPALKTDPVTFGL